MVLSIRGIAWSETMSQIDAEWLHAYADDVGLIGMPICRYCDKPIRLGSWADPFWPYYDEYTYHYKCDREYRREVGNEEPV